jgi:glutamyl-tRNA reductase
MRLVAAGVNYRATPLRARERAAASVADTATLLRYLIGHAGLTGAAVLSTCNRTEFYVTCPDSVAGGVGPRLARYLDPTDGEDMSRHLVARFDADAAGHLFRVAAGLESMLVGEAQVLGQLKQAHAAARTAGTVDARLDFVLRRAIAVGKRVRTETPIGRGTGNLSEAALDFAEQRLGGLRGRGVLLLGAGRMSAHAARRLTELGSRVFIASRSQSAELLAASVGGRAVEIGALDEVASGIDVILGSTSSSGTVLDCATIERLQEVRDNRPLYILDIAVPRDVDPAAANLDGVTLVDIDDLGGRLAGHPSQPGRAVQDAQRIIDSELSRTMHVLGERDAVTPTIAALQRRAEKVRRHELDRTLARTTIDDATRRRIDLMTQSMMSKLLHAPIAHLRESKDDPAVALTMREAFELED